MKTGWSIGKRRVEVDVNAMFVTVQVDEVPQKDIGIPRNLLGEWPIKVGKRDVRLRRVRNLDVARSELWVNGVKVPPSPEPIPWRKPPVDARCKPHSTGGGGYRSSGTAPAAKIACGVCRDPLCADCIAVDGVRCNACFERASEDLQKHERSLRIKGALAGLVIALFVALLGLVAESPRVIVGGAVTALLVGYLVVSGLIRERIEAKARARRQDG